MWKHEWGLQKGPFTKKEVLQATALFLRKKLEPLKKSWFDVPTTEMFIFILFVNAEALFEYAFSQWVSLNALFFYKNSLNSVEPFRTY